MLQGQGQELAVTMGGLGKPPCCETQVKPQLFTSGLLTLKPCLRGETRNTPHAPSLTSS